MLKISGKVDKQKTDNGSNISFFVRNIGSVVSV